MMDATYAIEWLKFHYKLTIILLFSWILDSPQLRSDDMTDGEGHQINLAIMDKFRGKIPTKIKLSLLSDVDDNSTTNSTMFSS